jgi:hypothetical protein
MAANERINVMTIDRSVMMFAGFMILLSVLLSVVVSPLWLWLTVFVGANLIQSSITGFCPAAMVFRKLGVKSGTAFD